ncbi:MAG: pilus assembly protein PilM [Nannocystaceae bacterium]
MAQKFVGLDLGTHEVKAVLVSAGLRTAQVIEVHEEAVVRGPQGDDSLDAALEVGISVLKRRGWGHYPVGVILPGGVGSYRVLRFPFGDARRIAQAINFEVEGQFPVSADLLEIDHLVVSGTRNLGQALVAAVRKDVVAQVVSAFQAADVDLKAITVPPLAHAQALPEPPPPLADPTAAEGRTPVALIVDIGHRNSEMVVIGPKGPIAARSLRRGGFHVTRAIAGAYRIDPVAAEARKVEEGVLPLPGQNVEVAKLAEVIAGALDPLVREVEHTRLWLRAELGCEVTVIRLIGGGARLRGLPEYFTEEIGVPVELARPRESGTLRKVDGRDWSTADAALGGALAASRRPLIQLYEDGGSRGTEGAWLSERLSTLAMIGLSIMAFGALDTVAKLKAYELEEAAYTEELAQVTKSVFEEEITDVAEIEARLGEVEGGDVTSLIAQHSALDVVQAITKALTPKGPKPVELAAPGGGEGEEGEESPAVGPMSSLVGVAGGPVGASAPLSAQRPDGKAESTSTPSASSGGTSTPGASASAQGGVTWDDGVIALAVEVRLTKIELTVSATKLSSGSRVKNSLRTIPCVTQVEEGRNRDDNDRKLWDFTLDHDCFYQPLEEDA